MKRQIFAYKESSGKYLPEHTVENIDEELWKLEYGDVANSEFQIWEHPSGKIFDVVSDRVVGEKDYYGTPSHEVWLPLLKYSHTDQETVNSGYERLGKK